MRWSALIVVFVLGVVGWSSPAAAEKVKTNQSAKLYSHPGEAGTVLGTIKSGQAMTVLSKEGRWLKVRVNGRTGYVPRSKVDLPDDDEEIQRNTRRRPFVDGRGTKRGFGGEAGPDDRVGGDAVGEGADAKDGDSDPADEPTGKGGKGKGKLDKGKADKGKADKGKTGKGKGGKGKGDDEPADVEPAEDGAPGAGGGDKEEPSDTRPIVHVTASTKTYQDPKKGSEVAFKAKPSDKLYIEDTRGKWTEVSLEEGDAGWLLTSQLDMEDAGMGTNAITKRQIDLRARAGLTIINQGVRSAGSTMVGVPDNYNIGTAAATLALGGQYLMPYGKDYILGGELAYDFEKSYPGIAYMGQNIGFSVHNLNLRAMAGYDLHKSNGMSVFGRLGYHYQSFLVSNVTDLTTNTAKIPSEVYKAPTLGVALWIPRLTPKIGIRASLDAVLFGASLTQTKNLEDGATPAAQGICLGGQFTYRWKPNMDLQATYDLNYAGINFGAPVAGSMRGHTGTDVTRTDIFHTVAFGITRAF